MMNESAPEYNGDVDEGARGAAIETWAAVEEEEFDYEKADCAAEIVAQRPRPLRKFVKLETWRRRMKSRQQDQQWRPMT